MVAPDDFKSILYQFLYSATHHAVIQLSPYVNIEEEKLKEQHIISMGYVMHQHNCKSDIGLTAMLACPFNTFRLIFTQGAFSTECMYTSVSSSLLTECAEASNYSC